MAGWSHIQLQCPVTQQLGVQQHPRLGVQAALPAPLDGLAAVQLQHDQVAAAITVVVALAWVKMFDVLTNTGILEQVGQGVGAKGWQSCSAVCTSLACLANDMLVSYLT